MIGGAIIDQKGGCSLKTRPVRDGNTGIRAHGDFLGEPTARGHGEHAIANIELSHISPYFANDACYFIAGDEGQRRFDLIEPCDHECVHVAEAGCFDIDHDLVGPQRWFRHGLSR